MLPVMASSIQDRTPEFHSILSQAQKTLARQRKTGPQAQPLLQNGGAATPPTRKQRSEFARNAAAIGRGISATMGKLQRLGELAKRKTLFDDRPVEIAELTYVIKQDLAGLNQQIGNLQTIQRGTQAGASNTTGQEGEHNKNVVMLLQGKLADVGVNFKEVLEVRTKNIQASRSRQDNFVSSVSQSHAPQSHLAPNGDRSDSPLYQPPSRSRTPGGGAQQSQSSPYASDVLSLDPSSSSPLYNNSPQSQQQLQIMEEGSSSNSYIQQRGEAIEAIERTIADLGGIFGQLATMVSEQAEQIQRIDANTDDVVDNVEGAQRELMKYWGRVQGNRWLVAKMFGVLMICESSIFLVAILADRLSCGYAMLTILPHSLPPLGPHSRLRAPRHLTYRLGQVLLLLLLFCTVHTPSVTITQNFLHITNDLSAFLQDNRGQKELVLGMNSNKQA
jgi:syntaxin 5